MANGAWWAAAMAVLIGGSYPRAARAADTGQGASPLADDRTLVALAVALACADAPQAEPPPASGPELTAPANDGPELELVATVRAKALKFDVVPRTLVAFQGSGRRRTVWKTERVNLPMHPQPGVTYRDVAVRLTVSSDIQELSSLLREAKKASAGIQLEEDPPAPPAAAPAAGATAKPAALPAPKAGSTSAATPAAPKAPAAPTGPAAPTATPAPASPAAPTAARTSTAAPAAIGATPSCAVCPTPAPGVAPAPAPAPRAP